MRKIKSTPYFLWDYDLSENEVRDKIENGDTATRLFLIARILESARYDDIWRYLTLSDILKVFPQLKLKKEIKTAWEKAFASWGVNYSYGKTNTATT